LAIGEAIAPAIPIKSAIDFILSSAAISDSVAGKPAIGAIAAAAHAVAFGEGAAAESKGSLSLLVGGEDGREDDREAVRHECCSPLPMDQP
jgi:hypothetical protein